MLHDCLSQFVAVLAMISLIAQLIGSSRLPDEPPKLRAQCPKQSPSRAWVWTT
jgi:hypothetical protein